MVANNVNSIRYDATTELIPSTLQGSVWKDAQDLEGKLNDPVFTPAGYAVTHLAFNSARAEYLLILEDERNEGR